MISEEVREAIPRGWRVVVDRARFRDCLNVYVFRYRPEQPRPDIQLAVLAEGECVPEDGQFSDATLRLTQVQGQELIDELWQCGLRPTEGAGSAGALTATQRHLDDMRKLVFEKWLRR